MSNDASSTLATGPPPPPYTPDEYPQHPSGLPDSLNLSRLAEQTLRQINDVSYILIHVEHVFKKTPSFFVYTSLPTYLHFN
jgi:hypothetical protein